MIVVAVTVATSACARSASPTSPPTTPRSDPRSAAFCGDGGGARQGDGARDGAGGGSRGPCLALSAGILAKLGCVRLAAVRHPLKLIRFRLALLGRHAFERHDNLLSLAALDRVAALEMVEAASLEPGLLLRFLLVHVAEHIADRPADVPVHA